VHIGEAAERSGVPAKTIRYYEEIGLLPTPDRGPNGYRRYSDDVLGRLSFIRAAQASGFTLGEIRGVIALRDRGRAPCAHVRTLIDERAAEVDRRIADLQAVRAELRHLARRARRLDPSDCDPGRICHLIGPDL